MRLVVAVIAFSLTTTAVAQQQPRCWPPGMIEQSLLKSKYAEQITGVGIADSGQRIAVYANAETGTFTVLITTGHITCIAAVGKGWATIETAKPGKEM